MLLAVAKTKTGLVFSCNQVRKVPKTRWEVPLSQKPGRYRFVVTAKKYHLSSKPFKVSPSRHLKLDNGRLAYPQPVVNHDITYRPAFASKTRRVKGRLQDRYGNSAG